MAEIAQLKSGATVIEIRERDAVLADLAQAVRRENGYAVHADLTL